jgi:hypothetical protein
MRGYKPSAQSQTWMARVVALVWYLLSDLSINRDLARNYTTVSIALCILSAHKYR